MNADNEQMAGIFRALTQIMSKGKVQAEELRGQLGDRLSGAFQLMAKAIGVTTGELNEMLEAGEVMADRETILAFAETFNSEFGDQLPEALETASAKIGRFRALLDEMRIRFAEGGFIDAFIEGLDRVNGFLDSREGEDFFESLGAAAGRFVGFLNNVADNIELVMRAFQALFALKVIQFFNALRFQFASAVAGATAGRGAVNALTISLLRFGQTGRGPFAAGARAAGGSLLVFRGAAIRAATAVRSLWMALGGIPGIIVGAIAFLLPNLFGNMLGSVDLVNSALSRHERLLNRIRSRYVEATEAGTDWSDTLEDISVAEARANLRDLEAGFDQAVGNIEGQLGRLRRAASFSNSGDRVALNTVVRMVGTLRDGRITVDQFSSALNRISEEATSPAFDEFRRSVQEYIENAANAEEQTEAAAAVIRVVTGEATDADRALLGLARAADDANVAMATGDAEAYAEAIGSIEDAIPDLKDLREFREEQEKLAAAFAEAEAAASSFAERADARAAYDAALDSLSDERVNNFDYDSVVDRIAPATADSIARLELERELRSAADYLQEAGAEYLTQTNLMLASMVGPEAALGIVQNPNGALSAEQSASTGGASTGAQAIAFASAAAGKSDVQVQLETELARLAADRAEAQREFNAQIDEANAAREFELGLEGESARQAEIARALREAETEAANEGVRLSADRRAEIERTVGAQFDQEETARRLELIEQERLNLARLRGEQETEAQFIQRRAREANIDLLSEEGERYAEILRQVYAVEQATRDREESERNLNALQEQRRIIMEQMELANQEGDGEAYTALREQLVGINDELLVAIDRMIAFYQAMGGAEAEAAIMRLRQVKDTVSDTSTESGILRTQIKRTFANEVTSAVDKFGKAVAQGENFFKAAGQAFRQFAADFLRQISLMIIRTLILRALGVPVGGGAGGGGIMSQLFGGSELHEGGEVGSGGAPRAVSASWFTNAKRYHNGGMPGLGSREVPAILEKGEEVLTRDDPRHAANGGGGSKPNVKIVNAIDPAEFLSKALDSPDGEEAILNFFRANPDAVKGAMS
jgi:tape measure domain-containing protein